MPEHESNRAQSKPLHALKATSADLRCRNHVYKAMASAPQLGKAKGPCPLQPSGDWAGEGAGRCMRTDRITHTAGPSSSPKGGQANSNSATPQPSPHLSIHSEETSFPLNTLRTVLRQVSHTSVTYDLISSSRFKVQHICKSTIDQKTLYLGTCILSLLSPKESFNLQTFGKRLTKCSAQMPPSTSRIPTHSRCLITLC